MNNSKVKVRLAYQELIDELRVGLEHQLDKWGVQNHDPDFWVVIEAEEMGEAAQGAYEWRKSDNEERRGYWREAFEYEMIHVASVALAAIESVRRQAAERTHEEHAIRDTPPPTRIKRDIQGG